MPIMNYQDFLIIVLLVLYGHFMFYQQYHCKNFQGSNQLFGALLAFWTFFAVIFFYGFLIIYALKVSILKAVLGYLANLATGFVWYALEARLKLQSYWWIWSISGFVVLPIFGFILVRYGLL